MPGDGPVVAARAALAHGRGPRRRSRDELGHPLDVRPASSPAGSRRERRTVTPREDSHGGAEPPDDDRIVSRAMPSPRPPIRAAPIVSSGCALRARLIRLAMAALRGRRRWLASAAATSARHDEIVPGDRSARDRPDARRHVPRGRLRHQRHPRARRAGPQRREAARTASAPSRTSGRCPRRRDHRGRLRRPEVQAVHRRVPGRLRRPGADLRVLDPGGTQRWRRARSTSTGATRCSSPSPAPSVSGSRCR